MKVWHQGRVGEAAQCSVSILDHGLLCGDGVFEGIRITRGRVFSLDLHLTRLFRSAAAIGLTLPYAMSELRNAVLATARANNAPEAYVRIVATRGVGELGVDPASCTEPQLFCIVADLKMFPATARARGLSLMTSAWRRPASDSLDPQIKSLNYLNNVLAKRDARLKGFDEALLLNQAGRISEASGANLFLVLDGKLVTPPCSERALGGITRDSVMRCQEAAGLGTTMCPVTRYDLLAASEAFLCGSGAGLVAVASLDGSPIGGPERPVLTRLAADWSDYAQIHSVAF